MTTLPALTAQILDLGPIALVVIPVLIVLGVITLVVRQYKRCPSNRVLVVYGKTGGGKFAKCVHGGGVFVVPLVQEYGWLSLEPITIEIDLRSALSLKNIRVNVPSTFTIGISTDPSTMYNAAERLLGLRENDIANQARDIILGQLRLVIATLTIEQINQDRETFLDLVNKNVGTELTKIGLEVINVNITDITDESGYIDAIGRKAAAEAINKAKVEVAEANRNGAVGEATANREMDVKVAEQQAGSAIGKKEAERDQRIRVAKLEAEGVSGEAEGTREQEVATAQQRALAVQGSKEAEKEQRVKVAEYEADAVEGENTSKAEIAAYNATLSEREAEARRRGEVARAEAARDVLRAEAEQEQARLEKEQIVQQNIEKEMIQIDADAEAERQRRIAKGEADAILARYQAEAEGQRKVLEAKAEGYRQLLSTTMDRPDLVPTLLMVEKLPELVAEQVKAIQNLKIDKITVWDGGREGGENGSTAGFLRGLIGSLPPVHELARQAGVDLPGYLGTVERSDHDAANADDDAPAKRARSGGKTKGADADA